MIPPAAPGSADAGGSAAPAAAWSRLVALGFTGHSLVIEAGLGRLRITPTVVEWQPVQPRSGGPSPMPLPAPDALQAARLVACRTCSRYDGRCTLGGCGCTGLGNPAALLSRCPMGLWPAEQPAKPA